MEFGAQFGPADSDIAAVTNWLQANGFEVTQVSNGRTVIEFNGTAGQVKQAFGTAIHKYVVNGEEHLANVQQSLHPHRARPGRRGSEFAAQLPEEGAEHLCRHVFSKKPSNVTSPATEFTFNCLRHGRSTCYALAPYDFATIYDVLPLWTAATPINGTGVTIAIVGRTDINPNDATDLLEPLRA